MNIHDLQEQDVFHEFIFINDINLLIYVNYAYFDELKYYFTLFFIINLPFKAFNFRQSFYLLYYWKTK